MNNEHIKPESPAETRERCKAHSAEWLGDRVEFKPAGRSVPRALARGIFETHGYGELLPAEPRANTILKRSSREGSTPRHMVCRSFVSPNSDTPESIQILRVSGSGETGDNFDCLARVRIAYRTDPTTGEAVPFAVAKPPEWQAEFRNREARDRAIWIATRCNTLLHEAHNKDIGFWLRAMFAGIGAAQSLGGGNSYYVPAALCDRLHGFMSAIATQLGVYYVRDPKTTLGASHDRAVMAQAVVSSLQDDIAELKDELTKAVDKSGGSRKRSASEAFWGGKADELRSKIELYRAIVKKTALDELDDCAELYRQHFTTLLDGGKVAWGDGGDEGDEGGGETIPISPASEPPSTPEQSGASFVPSASVAHVAWA